MSIPANAHITNPPHKPTTPTIQITRSVQRLLVTRTQSNRILTMAHTTGTLPCGHVLSSVAVPNIYAICFQWLATMHGQPQHGLQPNSNTHRLRAPANSDMHRPWAPANKKALVGIPNHFRIPLTNPSTQDMPKET